MLLRGGGGGGQILVSEAAKFVNYTDMQPLLDRNTMIGTYAQSIGFKCAAQYTR